MLRLLIATANPGKIREFRQMLGSDRFQWTDLSEHREVVAPDEAGKTFRANACLKAAYYAQQLACWAVADDSGLVVDALGGRPGVLSARWAQVNRAGSGDVANNALLLRQLAGMEDRRRTARFVCCLALSDPQGRIVLSTQDSVDGVIGPEARGDNGFGYDPLFYFPEQGKTTAQMEPDQKHAISHRGRALRRLRKLMDQLAASGFPAWPPGGG